MKAIIIAGGKGTRLAPLTDTLPKALVPIDEQNLTEHVLEILKKHGITDVTLSLAHMSDKVKEYFENNKPEGVNLSYLEEKEPMGTAGPLLLLKQSGNIPDEDFLMLNGDNLYSMDISDMIEFHKKHPGLATVALHEVDDPSSFGVVDMDDTKIKRFVEKPIKEEAPSNKINSGYYVLSPEVFDYVPDGDRAMMEHDIFPQLAEAGLLHGYEGQGQWFDTGTPERYDRVKKEWRGVKKESV